MIDVIDSLDFEPVKEEKSKDKVPVKVSVNNVESLEENGKKGLSGLKEKGLNLKKEKKPKAKVPLRPPDPEKEEKKKKSLTIALAALLIFAVGGGVFFYLRLAAHKDKTKYPTFELNDITIMAGDALTYNVIDYGNFSTVDMSTCSLQGINEINTSKPGVYKYSVTCGKVKKTGNITVNKASRLEYETLVIYKNKDDKYSVNDFIVSDNEYTFTYDDDKVASLFRTTGNLNSLKINVEDTRGNYLETYAALYVTKNKVSNYLSCTNDPYISEEEDEDEIIEDEEDLSGDNENLDNQTNNNDNQNGDNTVNNKTTENEKTTKKVENKTNNESKDNNEDAKNSTNEENNDTENTDEFVTIDKFVFDEDKKYINASLRVYKFYFDSEEEFNDVFSTIKDTGILRYKNREGIAIVNAKELSISIVTKLERSTLISEYGDTFSTRFEEIRKYYRTNKNYKCF